MNTEHLVGLLENTLGPLGPVFLLGALGVVLVACSMPLLAKKRKDPIDRLRHQVDRSGTDRNAENRLRTDQGTKKLDKYATFLEPQDQEELAGMRLMLLQAGYREKSAVRAFHFVQFVLGLAFLTFGVLYVVILAPEGLATQNLALAILLPGVAGYYLPKYWVERRRQERQGQIESGFPDALDLMLVCVEAGQSLDQAIIRVATEMRSGYPALAEEFELVAHEMKAGKDKVQVLKDMSERAGVSDVSSFVTVLIQSASFGTSIAEALRVYASEMRDKRVMRAEEKANVLPTKLTLGTMMFTVPPLMIILIGPSIYGIYVHLNGGG